VQLEVGAAAQPAARAVHVQDRRRPRLRPTKEKCWMTHSGYLWPIVGWQPSCLLMHLWQLTYCRQAAMYQGTALVSDDQLLGSLGRRLGELGRALGGGSRLQSLRRCEVKAKGGALSQLRHGDTRAVRAGRSHAHVPVVTGIAVRNSPISLHDHVVELHANCQLARTLRQVRLKSKSMTSHESDHVRLCSYLSQMLPPSEKAACISYASAGTSKGTAHQSVPWKTCTPFVTAPLATLLNSILTPAWVAYGLCGTQHRCKSPCPSMAVGQARQPRRRAGRPGAWRHS